MAIKLEHLDLMLQIERNMLLYELMGLILIGVGIASRALAVDIPGYLGLFIIFIGLIIAGHGTESYYRRRAIVMKQADKSLRYMF